MARTIAEIKKEMTDAYISNSIIRDIYGITGDADFDSVFSPVSIESTLFYIFAATAHVIEQMFDQFKTDVEERIDANIYRRCAGIIAVRWLFSMVIRWSMIRKNTSSGIPLSTKPNSLSSMWRSKIAGEVFRYSCPETKAGFHVL